MTELLRVEELEIAFTERGRLTNRPVRGVSFTIAAGEVLGIVGETGCGKSLTGLAVLGMLPAGARPRGRVVLDGAEQSLAVPSPARGDVVSIVFQNPGTAFNPVFTLGAQLRGVVRRHRRMSRGQARERILEYFGLVGLPDPVRVFDSYPHELSGGMLQRVMIAMALIGEPRLLILDEPTTALDVTIARQILQLVLSLRDRFGFGVLLITHNLGIVQEVCDTVAVLYAGRVIESGPSREVLSHPAHPYTRGLLGALPSRRRDGGRLEAIRGSVPADLRSIAGCAFADRCPIVQERCRATDPSPVPVGLLHEAACLRAGEVA